MSKSHSFAIRNFSSLVNRPFYLAVPAVFALMAWSSPAQAATAASPTTAPPAPAAAAPAAAPEQHGIQVADEIIRRLRRLGINVNPARIDRPYDPAGELC